MTASERGRYLDADVFWPKEIPESNIARRCHRAATAVQVEFSKSSCRRRDSEVYRRMPLSTRAVASGLVTGASHLRGGSPLITPMDVARISAGMGSGYLSGAIVGKVTFVAVLCRYWLLPMPLRPKGIPAGGILPWQAAFTGPTNAADSESYNLCRQKRCGSCTIIADLVSDEALNRNLR